MKTLKFLPHLVPLVLSGEKVSTWRLFDDKDLAVGDEIEFINKGTGETFAKAVLESVRAKRLGEIEDLDFAQGHERYPSTEAMIAHFREIYGRTVSPDTEVKIVSFRLVS